VKIKKSDIEIDTLSFDGCNSTVYLKTLKINFNKYMKSMNTNISKWFLNKRN